VAGDQRRTRLENLERLTVPAATTGGRSTADDMAGCGFSLEEMERAALWFEAALRAQEPLIPENYNEHQADEVVAMHGADWLACRFEHGPEICDVDCVGEYRHRPAWQPRPGGPPLTIRSCRVGQSGIRSLWTRSWPLSNDSSTQPCWTPARRTGSLCGEPPAAVSVRFAHITDDYIGAYFKMPVSGETRRELAPVEPDRAA
jgi:hypothetical protein